MDAASSPRGSFVGLPIPGLPVPQDLALTARFSEMMRRCCPKFLLVFMIC